MFARAIPCARAYADKALTPPCAAGVPERTAEATLEKHEATAAPEPGSEHDGSAAHAGLLTRIRHVASCAGAPGSSAAAGDHEMSAGLGAGAGAAEGQGSNALTLSQRLSCYSSRHAGTLGDAAGVGAGGATAGNNATVKQVVGQLQGGTAASVVAINRQRLLDSDIQALMQALRGAWDRSATEPVGVRPCVRKLYLGQGDIGDTGAALIAQGLSGGVTSPAVNDVCE